MVKGEGKCSAPKADSFGHFGAESAGSAPKSFTPSLQVWSFFQCRQRNTDVVSLEFVHISFEKLRVSKVPAADGIPALLIGTHVALLDASKRIRLHGSSREILGSRRWREAFHQ